jgi:hypothetical protein
MPWVRGHYARSPRTSRRSELSLALVVVAVIAFIVVVWYVTTH